MLTKSENKKFPNDSLIWATSFLVFIAPLPLGLNRAWAWFAFSALLLIVLSASVLTSRGSIWSNVDRMFFVSLLGFGVIPIIQIIPIFSSGIEVTDLGQESACNVWGYRTISVDPARTSEVAIYQFAMIVFCLSLYHKIVSHRFLSVLSLSLVLAAIFNIIVGVSLLYFGIGLSETVTLEGQQIISGSYVNPNHFASLLVLAFPFAFLSAVLSWRNKYKYRLSGLFWLVCSTFILAGLVSSQSRGALAALVISGVVLWLVNKFKASVLPFAILYVFILAVSLAFFLIVIIDDSQIINFSLADESLRSRILQWKDSVDEIACYFMAGTGLGTYEFVFPMFKGYELSHLFYDHAHNDYLEVLVTLGVPGFALLLTAIIRAFWLFGQSAHITQAVSAPRVYLLYALVWSALAFLVHSVVEFNLQIPANFFIFMMVLVSIVAVSINMTADVKSKQ